MSKDDKTNVMRLLDQAGIDYQAYQRQGKGSLPSTAPVYKTLVTQGRSAKDHYVFVIPVDKKLNLKWAAQAVGEKKISMIKEKELLPLTGYVHGGCSPIGMKKALPTVLDQSAAGQDWIIFSAGKVGYSVEVRPDDLSQILDFSYAQLAE